MIGPERRIDNAHVLHGDVLGVGDIDISRTQGLEVGTVTVELSANPEFLPVGLPVAVDSTRAGDGEAVASVGIDQGSKVVECLPLHAGLQELEVADAVAATQFAVLLDKQVCAWLEEERAADHEAPWNDHHSPTLLGTAIDDGLQPFGLHLFRVVLHPIVRNDIALTQLRHVDT